MSGVHVRVRVAGEHYALPVEGVLEVAELGDVTLVPGAPPGVLGVRNLLGQLITVVDLAGLFGLVADGPPERIVVTEEGDRRAGLAVHSILEVESFSQADRGCRVRVPSRSRSLGRRASKMHWRLPTQAGSRRRSRSPSNSSAGSR